VPPFVYDIFTKDDAEFENEKNLRIYLRCNEKMCINPSHFVRTTEKLSNRLKKIGWNHFGKPEKEIVRLFELQTLLENGKEDENGCLLGTGYIHSSGYAQSAKGLAHRHRWQLENPDISLNSDIHVRHKCKNKSCFAIEHLEIGTARENAKDKIRDGTQLMGENTPFSKISKELAQQIKDSKKVKGKNGMTQRERANQYDVSLSIVNHIDHGTRWGHLPFRGKPDPRKGINAEKEYNKRQRTKQRIPTKEDYEKCWKRIRKSCKESSSCGDTLEYNDPCLLFQKLRKNGYGYIFFMGTMKSIHIVVWEKFHNDSQKQDDNTKVIRHLCGNRACVQPSHLKRGTNSENQYDKRKHGTMPGMSEAQAREIWRLKEEGFRVQQISDKMNIKYRTVSRVFYRKSHLYIHENPSNYSDETFPQT